jgi:hypothetical protein
MGVVARTTKGNVKGFENPTCYIEVAKGENGKHCCGKGHEGRTGIPPLPVLALYDR